MHRFFLWMLCLIVSGANAEKPYYLCGPDEDGCPSDDYTSCLCVASRGPAYAYCLDISHRRCFPLSVSSDCHPDDIFKYEGECLATLLQSEPQPPCQSITKKFCIQHHVPFFRKYTALLR